MINPNKLRQHVLNMVYAKQSGHIGGSFSLAEIIAYLYDNYELLDGFEKDILILSKGHAVPILYAVLYELGILSDSDIKTYRELNSKLQGHPHQLTLPKYIHATTGSLGQGLSLAIGHALATSRKVFCIIGDGELQEGQIWEAIQYAPHTNISNLICILDNNRGQGDGEIIIPLELDKLTTILTLFGWDVSVIDGHNMEEIQHAMSITSDHPRFIIANTIKGKGVSYMEGVAWHSRIPTPEEYIIGMEQLNESN